MSVSITGGLGRDVLVFEERPAPFDHLNRLLSVDFVGDKCDRIPVDYPKGLFAVIDHNEVRGYGTRT